MTDNFIKQTKKTAKEQAIKTAKQIAREPSEILKDARSEVTGTPDVHEPKPSVMEQVMTGDGKTEEVSPQEEQSIHSQTKSRLSQIEAELKRLREQREQKSQGWSEEQERLMEPGEQVPEEKYKPVELPSSPKKGPASPHMAKKGTKEMGRTRKG